eukprot:1559772-Prymnesium_polylepis.1
MPGSSTLYSLCLIAECASRAGRATVPTTTYSQRPTTTSTSRRPAARVARRSYHFYVIDDLVDEARRQGVCRDA